MLVTPIHKSKPPLRWIANLFNHISSPHLVKIVMLDEYGLVDTFAYKYNSFMYRMLDYPYRRWGTTYLIGEWLNDEFNRDEIW